MFSGTVGLPSGGMKSREHTLGVLGPMHIDSVFGIEAVSYAIPKPSVFLYFDCSSMKEFERRDTHRFA